MNFRVAMSVVRLSRSRLALGLGSIALLGVVALALLVVPAASGLASRSSGSPNGKWLWQGNGRVLYLTISDPSGEADYVVYDDANNRIKSTGDPLVVTRDRRIEFTLQNFLDCHFGCPYALKDGSLVLVGMGSSSMTLQPATSDQNRQIVSVLQSNVTSAAASEKAKQQAFGDGQAMAQKACAAHDGLLMDADATWVCYFPQNQPIQWIAFFQEPTGKPFAYACADYEWATTHGVSPDAVKPGVDTRPCSAQDVDLSTAKTDCTSGAYFKQGPAYNPSDNTTKRYDPPFVWHDDLAVCTAQVMRVN
jgi:hypothetical protein